MELNLFSKLNLCRQVRVRIRLFVNQGLFHKELNY